MLKTLSVSELSFYITKIFEAEELLYNVKVYGEVSNLSNVRGNLYFNLKDENSLMPCILFGATSTSVKEGDQVLCTGNLRYYSKGGKLNLYVNSVVPYGSGILYQKFIELKNKLEQEGVFSEKYKKPLPRNIKTIGVITSATGAVIHDIQTVSLRRNPSLNIVVYPAKVQGTGAELTIIKGLEVLDKINEIDVIIIARGGGSIEDLQPFNTESLARAIIKTDKPVISAVGHETDFTICDFSSSVRAATPSEAAELISVNVAQELEKIINFINKIEYLIYHLLDANLQRVDLCLNKMENSIKNLFVKSCSKFNNGLGRINTLLQNSLIEPIHRFEKLNNSLLLLNPKKMLENGWAKLLKNNNVILSTKDLSVDDEVTVELSDGKVNAKVSALSRDMEAK